MASSAVALSQSTCEAQSWTASSRCGTGTCVGVVGACGWLHSKERVLINVARRTALRTRSRSLHRLLPACAVHAFTLLLLFLLLLLLSLFLLVLLLLLLLVVLLLVVVAVVLLAAAVMVLVVVALVAKVFANNQTNPW